MFVDLHNAMFILSLFISHLTRNVQGSLVIKPQNVATTSGGVVTLNCATDSGDKLAWAAYSPGSSDRDNIVVGCTVTGSAPKYVSVSQPEKGHCYLHINTTREAAGRYICQEQESTKDASAELIIIERNPECLTKVTAEFVNMTCSVKFAGNWAPTMEWRTQDGSQLKAERLPLHSDLATSSLFLPLNWTANYTSYKLNVVTRFNDSGKPALGTAVNVPDYNHTISPYSSGFEYVNVTQIVERESDPAVVGSLMGLIVVLALVVIALTINTRL